MNLPQSLGRVFAKNPGILLTCALLGVPIVLAYTVSIYWIFRGKVKLDKLSY